MPDLDRRTAIFSESPRSRRCCGRKRLQRKSHGSQARESRFSFATAQQAKLSPCKLTSEESGGSCTAFELSAMPQTGPYQHVHHREDEWYYVLSGEFLFKAGGEEHTLPVGASIWLPKGIPHVWANVVLRRAS